MSRRRSNPSRRPEVAPCAGCGRNLVVSNYALADFPPEDTPDERVTWITVPQGTPTYNLHCTCAHWTVVTVLSEEMFRRRKSDD